MHENAAGASIPDKDLASFHAWANKRLSNTKLDEGCYDVHFVRSAANEDLKDLIFDIAKYESIWSQQCDEPRIYVHDINLKRADVQVIGAKKDTIKFTKFGVTYIKFHAEDLIDELRFYDEAKVEVVGRCNLNEWNNNVTPQVLIEGYEVQDNKFGF